MTKSKMAKNPLSTRVEQTLYDQFVKESIARSVKEKRLVKISELVREALNSYINRKS